MAGNPGEGASRRAPASVEAAVADAAADAREELSAPCAPHALTDNVDTELEALEAEAAEPHGAPRSGWVQ